MNSIMDLPFLLFMTVRDLFNVVGVEALTPLLCVLLLLLVLCSIGTAASSYRPHRSWDWWLWETVRLPALRSIAHRKALSLQCEETDSLDGLKSAWAGTPFNWEYCTPLLLLGSPRSKRGARKAFVGDKWADFVKAVPPAERVAIYKAALILQESQVDRRQGDDGTSPLRPEERRRAQTRAKQAYGGAHD